MIEHKDFFFILNILSHESFQLNIELKIKFDK